ncbi:MULTISPECIES: hypothetical protein [Prescottella]|uniref:hypothetical protein n=1 Tax=Prescottella TaxID=2979332 RepID=UPI0015852917|nr:hypothetical protein [Prescottella equi]UNQ39831.1 hypothetical protein MPC38_00650 [Prescottella equi]BCN46818.1 hypothetical protein RE9416_01190 [Prescottella equi]BCN61665.1 hypothetical protein RE9431_01200 [Prescottella equi]BCN71520.1 hypothetical protein RE0327_01190 [Prescottella equi]BCN81478.1 hypothetical protein RE0356_01190 [Prescottella equi]
MAALTAHLLTPRGVSVHLFRPSPVIDVPHRFFLSSFSDTLTIYRDRIFEKGGVGHQSVAAGHAMEPGAVSLRLIQ